MFLLSAVRVWLKSLMVVQWFTLVVKWRLFMMPEANNPQVLLIESSAQVNTKRNDPNTNKTYTYQLLKLPERNEQKPV